MKKFLFLVLFLIPSISFASISFSVPSPQVFFSGVSVFPTCTIGNVVTGFFSDGLKADTGTLCNPNTGGRIDFNFNSNYSRPDTYTIVECNTALSLHNCGNTYINDLADARADLGYIGETTYIFTAPPAPPVLGLTFFGGQSSGTGGATMDAPAFLSQTATALDATASGIYPILAIVAGLILTFIVIKKIIGLYKQTGGQSKKIK
jgi:hypothetical protein